MKKVYRGVFPYEIDLEYLSCKLFLAGHKQFCKHLGNRFFLNLVKKVSTINLQKFLMVYRSYELGRKVLIGANRFEAEYKEFESRLEFKTRLKYSST